MAERPIRESAAQAITDLSDAVQRAGAIVSANVWPVYPSGVERMEGDRGSGNANWAAGYYRCAVLVEGVNGTHAFHPRFRSRQDCEAFRAAALDIMERAT